MVLRITSSTGTAELTESNFRNVVVDPDTNALVSFVPLHASSTAGLGLTVLVANTNTLFTAAVLGDTFVSAEYGYHNGYNNFLKLNTVSV